MSPEQQAHIAAWMIDAAEVLERTGAHSEHAQKQIGRCVYCSCGKRVQGRMKK